MWDENGRVKIGKKTASLWTLGEPLFLGLSCLVGGEQFYLLLYGTGRSVRGQSFVLVFTAIITCIMSAAVSNRTDILAHFFHLFYIYIIILQMTIANELTGGIIATIVTIGLGYALTMLVIQSCSLYSNSKEELLSFILGMLSARYLPCFFRLLVSKGYSCDCEIRKLSKALGVSRLVFCILSLALKILMGRFQLTYSRPAIFVKIGNSGNNSQQTRTGNGIWSKIVEIFTNDWQKVYKEASDFYKTSLEAGFRQMLDHTKYLINIKVLEATGIQENWYTRYLIPIFKLLPILMFLTSVFIFLMYPKTSFSAYCSYSPKVISILMNVKFLSHIIGSLFGIGCPVSATSNSALFPTITLFFYSLVVYYFSLSNSDKYFKKNFVYFIVGVSSFVLGYMWSYNLGIIVNIVLRETCTYEEMQTFDKKKISFEKGAIKMKKTCCGDKITSKCYCKLEEIFNFLDLKYEGRTFVCSTLLVSPDQYLSYRYSQYGKCAILLILNSDGSDSQQDCSTTCCNKDCKGNCCLKIIGKYKVDAVTISSCEDCQLTIRLEGTCCDPSKCPSCCNNGSDGSCVCNGQAGKCCCICVKCCNGACQSPGKCCCIHFCKNESGCNCNCNYNKGKDARLFICYKTKDKKCCIKEIRPNSKADFGGDLKTKNQFDIDHIFISDCCHADVRVDLKCTVKNNYFRLGGANYPGKFEKTELVRLFWSEGICCPSSATNQCCCMFSQLVTGHVMLVDESVESMNIEICKNGCKCPNGNSECCIMPCYLQVDRSGGFVKKVDRIRVKLVVISWLFFGLAFFLVVLMASSIRSKYSPVTFYPMTSYSKLAGTFASNKYNSNEQVTARILGLSVKGQISSQTIDAKKVEMKAMLSMFAKYTSKQETKKTKKRKPKEVEKIHKYITNKATSFSPSSSIGGRACELCVVEWSQCVGLVYKYVMPLFFFIQKFFIDWEKAWKIDFYNYKKQMMPYVTKVTHNSSISLSKVMSGVKVGDKSSQMGLKRLVTWNGGFKETRQLSREKMEEDNMRTETIPPKIGNRLCYYVRRWNHRLDNIRNWCEFESHVFDWAKFLHEYYKIREWVTDVSPGLRCDSEIKVSTKDLNRGIKIFIATM